MAGILAQMLRYKAQGATIEIHLAGGTMIVLDQFSPKDAQHVFFTSREADGTATVTVVGWSSLDRVVLRGLAEVPKEWF